MPVPGSFYARERLRLSLALHVLTDRQWSRGRGMAEVAAKAITGGATIIQLRDKIASTRLLAEEGLALRAVTRAHGALLIVNDRLDVALVVDADGLHIGQDDLPVEFARKLLGPHRVLGVSAGSLEEAVAGGADYLGVGPIFPICGKVDAGPATGTDLLTQLAARYTIPLVAIGGITVQNAPTVIQAGACGVAVITSVINAEDISLAACQLYAAIVTDSRKGQEQGNG